MFAEKVFQGYCICEMEDDIEKKKKDTSYT